MLCTDDAARTLQNYIGTTDSLHDRVRKLLHILDYELVEDSDTADLVHALRYKAYFEAGAAGHRADGRLSDAHDHDSHAASIALRFDGMVCASIRLHVVSEPWQHSPAMLAFPDELRPLVGGGRRLVDANCFCVDPALSGRIPELAYMMLRLPFITADLRPGTKITATVTARHRPFYLRILRCDEIAPPRPYAGRTRPLGLTLCDIARERANIVARNPSFEPLPGEAARIGLDRIGAIVPTLQDAEAA
jgi:hypothetical protein